MDILTVNKKNLDRVGRLLRHGAVIVYPTDTAYALGGIFNKPAVIKKILKIKGRQDPKFTLVASSLYQVEKFFKLNQIEKKLAKKYWPGPLSIVVSDRFAVRVPKNNVSKTLCRRAGAPLIATSANLTGAATPYRAADSIKQLHDKKNQPEVILDAGSLPKIKTSTLVKVTNGKIVIIRPGAVRLSTGIK